MGDEAKKRLELQNNKSLNSKKAELMSKEKNQQSNGSLNRTSTVDLRKSMPED